MKGIALIFGLLFSVFVGGTLLKSSSSRLNKEAISFLSMDGINEGFQIIANETIPKYSIIHFTDSEWNGNRFGADEGDLLWNTGDQEIVAGDIISFSSLDNSPITTIGSIEGNMRISKTKDAIFAYQGGKRLPQTFIAVIANQKEAVGTLVNTGLNLDVNSSTQITFTQKK